jgi:bifunctional DNase/RNase
MTDVQPEVAAAGTTPRLATFRVMDVDDVSLELPTQYPSVTLVEPEPPMRDLVFPVGLPEGTAMAQALRRLEGRRPMTHELFMQVLQRAHIDVIAVRLVGREDGNLLAELDLMTPGGRERVDCRPSDGIVLALRMPVPAPILVDERLLEAGGDVPRLEEPTGRDPGPNPSPGPPTPRNAGAPESTLEQHRVGGSEQIAGMTVIEASVRVMRCLRVTSLSGDARARTDLRRVDRTEAHYSLAVCLSGHR